PDRDADQRARRETERTLPDRRERSRPGHPGGGTRPHVREVLPWPRRWIDTRRGPRSVDRAVARRAARRHARLRGHARWRLDFRGASPGGELVKVLIVDDEPDVRSLVRSALQYARVPLEAIE